MNLYRNVSRLIFTITLAGALTGGLAHNLYAATIFEDGFEKGALTASTNGFEWTTATKTKVVTGNAKTGTYSLQLAYEAEPNGSDSWTEQRFSLGKNYPEIWVSYDIKIPSNYVHRDQTDSANNKGFLYLWEGEYGAASTLLLGPEFWPNSDGSSSASVRLRSQIHDKHFWDLTTNAIKLSDRGKWIHIVAHYKYASSKNNDGIVQIWKIYSDGTKDQIINLTDGAWYIAGAKGFQYGYLLGWSNSGFAQATTFYIDNFKASTDSLLDESTPAPQPPMPPSNVKAEIVP